MDQKQRIAILELHRKGLSIRGISQTMKLSRKVVRRVLRSNTAEVPRILREERAARYRDEILELHTQCRGNLVRVHEELVAQGADLSYQALTGYCRRHGIGHEPKRAVGHYHFAPGQEMQHDTSPHALTLTNGSSLKVQTASLVLCYSRVWLFQFYPRFRRFECKVFLTDALAYMEGACGHCMIDNTHLVVHSGTGAEMVPVPEMAAFGERYGFLFVAHAKGDANRSAVVERRFSHIENNFLAGRTFRDLDDANAQARTWCDRVNARYSPRLRFVPRALYAEERPFLKPLPAWTPPVYLLHQRIVDVEGYVSVQGNRYSVPEALIGRQVEVRETRNAIEVYLGPRLVSTHRRLSDALGRRVTLSEHRRPRGQRRLEPSYEETTLLALVPELHAYVTDLKKRNGGRGTLALRRLLRMVHDYPRAPLLAAVQTASHYGLYDLERLERLVLRHISQDYFKLGGTDDDEG